MTRWHRGGGESILLQGELKSAAHITRQELTELMRLEGSHEPTSWLVVDARLPLQPLFMGSGHHSGDPTKWALKRLRAFLMMERSALMAIFIYSIVIGLLTLIAPLTVQAMVNTIAFGVMLQPLIVLSLVLLVALSFAGVLRVVEYVVVEYIQRRFFVRLVTDLSQRLPRLNVYAHEKKYPPELLNRFFDVITIQKAISKLVLDSLEVILQVTLGMLLLAFYHPYLLAFDIILLLGIWGVLFVLGRGALGTSIEESNAKYASAAWLEEIVRRPLGFKSSSAMHVATQNGERVAMKYIDARATHFRIVLRQIMAATALQALASATLLMLGGWLVLKGQITLGQLVAAELIVTSIAASLSKLGKHLETYYDIVAALHKVGKLIDLPLEQDAGQRLQYSSVPHVLEFEGVTVLNGSCAAMDVELTLHPGEIVGLTGENRAALSLLLEAVYGWRELKKGVIRIDGVDIKHLALQHLRDQVELVHNGNIFMGTIDDNLRLGHQEISPDAVRHVLRRVGLNDELRALEDGLESELLVNGAPLTSDQLYRLTVARAVLSRPRLLLIDGLLDKIEPEHLAPVLATLFDSEHNWTVLVVSDVPAVLECCKRVLQLGRIGLEDARAARES